MATAKQLANQRRFAKAAQGRKKAPGTKKAMPAFLKKKLGRKRG